MRHRTVLAVAVLICASAITTLSQADVIIVSNVAGSQLSVTSLYPGQSLTTPSGGPWDHLIFSWLNLDGSRQAFGHLYLLSHEYTGLPSNLSASTPGFIAEATTITADEYVFQVDVTVQQETQFWFYADTEGYFRGRDLSDYSGGTGYVAGNPSQPFPTSFYSYAGDADFFLKGSPVPEPATFVLLGTALLGLWKCRWRAH